MSSDEAMPELGIVIPCYNEAENLELLIEKLKAVVDSFPSVEIILVDNGSTDNTHDILVNYQSSYSDWLRIVSVPVNQGYGFGIMQGVEDSRARIIAWSHADMQTNPLDIVDAYETFQGSSLANKVVKGRRVGRGILDTIFTAGMSLFASGVFGVCLSDVNAQPKLFDRKLLSNLRSYPSDFSLDLFFLLQAKRNGYKVLTTPVRFKKRLHGEAKGGGSMKGKFKLIKRTIIYILKTRFSGQSPP